jgi:hypothetical protein
MIILDFLYYSVYTLVSRKVVLGKRYGVLMIFSAFLSFLIIALFLLIHQYVFHVFNYIDVRIIYPVIMGGTYAFSRIWYWNFKKQREMTEKFSNVPEKLLKTVGVLYPFLCFILLVITSTHFQKSL